jgi:predicted NAD/FAD-binding protein
MLADPSEAEREILGAIPYQPNEAVLHTDRSLMPRRRAVWSSWNFHLCDPAPPATTVTYWMNHLQRLPRGRDYFLTLNRGEEIDPATVLRRFTYDHPVYTKAGVAAQERHAEISGVERRTHFAGAYWGWGFHEDGVVSGLRVAAGLEGAPPAATLPGPPAVAAGAVAGAPLAAQEEAEEALAA